MLAAISLALGTSGYALGDRFSEPTAKEISAGLKPGTKIFAFQARNLHNRPYSDEYFLPIRNRAGSVICVARFRAHEDGYVSILGVRASP